MISEYVSACAGLGKFFNDFCNGNCCNSDNDWFNTIIENATVKNPWFTRDNIIFACQAWANMLTIDNIQNWLTKYNNLVVKKSAKVGVIMAGNIPFAGLHDLICVLLSGNIFVGKISTKDDVLMSAVAQLLYKKNPLVKERIILTSDKIIDCQAYIASGSNNSARYFEFYFLKYPHIIRRNKNSVAVLSGTENSETLKLICNDIFVYFGLGCRSVSKIFVPNGYDFHAFFQATELFNHVLNHNKYANNLNYYRAIYMMNKISFLDNGFLLLKNDSSYSSPVANLYFEYYESLEKLSEKLIFDKENLQCVVSEVSGINAIAPGQAQLPELSEYADGIDTIDFLLKHV